jgi:hypothetical protein
MSARDEKSPAMTGAIVGGLLTAPLIALFYLASQAAGLPFVPFDLLDWSARTLPGGVITFGIDLIVSIIAGLNLGETSSAAKTAEHMLAIVGFWLAGVVAGAILFTILHARAARACDQHTGQPEYDCCPLYPRCVGDRRVCGVGDCAQSRLRGFEQAYSSPPNPHSTA